MIEINLLPGAKRAKKSAGGGPSIDFAALIAGISARFKDKWLGAAIATGAAAVAIIALLFLSQRTREGGLKDAESKAVADSTRYAAVLLDRMRLQARRDSAVTQLSIIRAIDEERYIWPHILEEVSRALPPYTWLREFGISGAAQGTNPVAAVLKMPKPDTVPGRKQPPRRDPVIPRDTIRLRMVGRTVDVQAFTRFMRTLEDSPFLEGVTLQRSEPQVEGGREVTQFVLDLMYTRPDSLLLRRVPLLQQR
jgi:Tfp pilus assembly protein PilN